MQNIKVYGRETCGDTQRTLAYLESTGVKFDYVDIEEDAAGLEFVQRHNHGRERVPTLDIGGAILVEPSDGELETALRKKRLV